MDGILECVAGVGATLLGLAFVTFQVRAEQWRSERLKHLVAVFTLAELGAPIVAALVCLMPGHPWRQASGVAAAVGFVLILQYRLAVKRTPNRDAFDERQRRWSWLTLAVSAALAIAAVVPDATIGLTILGSSLVWLFVSGAIESWIFVAPAWGQQASD